MDRRGAPMLRLPALLLTVAWAADPSSETGGNGTDNNDTSAHSPLSIFEQDPYLVYAAVAMAIAALTIILNFIVVAILCRYLGAAEQLESMVASGQVKTQGSGSVPSSSAAGLVSLAMPVEVPVDVDIELGATTSSSGGDFHSFGDCDAAEMQTNQKRSLLNSSSLVDFNGVWECTSTWGLEEFLIAMNTPKLKRMAAMRVPWPTWQITQDGDVFTLIIRSSFGVQTESFKADGSTYTQKDIEGNVNICTSYLKDTGFVIERTGKKGRAVESRMMNRDGTVKLTFEMAGCPVKWGRQFRRK